SLIIARTNSLGRIFDQRDSPLFGYSQDGIKIYATAEQMDRENRLGARTDPTRDRGRIEIEGSRLDIDKNRTSTQARHHSGRGEERIGGGDDLITGTNTQRHEGHEQSVSPGRHTQRETHGAKRRQFFFQGGDLRPQDEPLRFTYPVDRRTD